MTGIEIGLVAVLVLALSLLAIAIAVVMQDREDNRDIAGIAERLAVSDVEGIELVNVHPIEACTGRTCVVHSPTFHHMRRWPLHWRDDRTMFERICPHGIGHPDPDQFDYWRDTGQDAQGVHGCDGCCQRPRP